MGGACSRRLYTRTSSSNAAFEEGDTQPGAVVRSRTDDGVPAAHQGARVVAQPTLGLRDGFAVGPAPLPASRSFRVWAGGRGGVPLENAVDVPHSHGARLVGGCAGALGCMSRLSTSPPSSSSSSSSSSPSERIESAWGLTPTQSSSSSGSRVVGSFPSSSSLAFGDGACADSLQCPFHGPHCPVLQCRTLQERCLAQLCFRLLHAPDPARRGMLVLLTKDLTQRVLDKWVHTRTLTLPLLRCLSPGSVEAVDLARYPGVNDKWLLALRQQAQTLLAVDVGHCQALTDLGILQLLDANQLRSLHMNMCLQVTDDALVVLQDCLELQELSCQGCCSVTAAGLRNLAALSRLQVLDLERCPRVHGGLDHLSPALMGGLKVLNLGWCTDVDDEDLRVVAACEVLEVLVLSRTGVTDVGVALLKGLGRVRELKLAGCAVTDRCFEVIGGMVELQELDLGWCSDVTDAVLVHLRKLKCLRVLNLAYTAVGDGHASMFSDLGSLEELNLDSCAVTDTCMEHVADIKGIRSLDLSDTVVGNEGLVHLGRLSRLETLNLSFTTVTDAGVRSLASLASLRSLNIDSRMISDRALANLSTLTGLRSLDVFGAKVTDAGLAFLKGLKALESLEVCGGGITDAGTPHLQPLTSLTSLNLSQNLRLSDAGLAPLAALTKLHSLNLSSCKLSSAALVHLRGLPSLHSLALHSCKVSRSALSRTLASSLCLWPKDLVVTGVK